MRPIRMCDVCGGVDDHPRHVYGVADGEAPTSDAIAEKALKAAPPEGYASVLAHIRDDNTQVRHMDCCRDAGCPDRSCDLIHQSYEGPDRTGDKLLKHLTSGAVDDIGRTLSQKAYEKAVAEQEVSA